MYYVVVIHKILFVAIELHLAVFVLCNVGCGQQGAANASC